MSASARRSKVFSNETDTVAFIRTPHRTSAFMALQGPAEPIARELLSHTRRRLIIGLTAGALFAIGLGWAAWAYTGLVIGWLLTPVIILVVLMIASGKFLNFMENVRERARQDERLIDVNGHLASQLTERQRQGLTAAHVKGPKHFRELHDTMVQLILERAAERQRQREENHRNQVRKQAEDLF